MRQAATVTGRSIRRFRSDREPVDDLMHAFRALRDHGRPGAARTSHDRARERHDVTVGIHLDVAFLQEFLTNEALVDPRGDPRVRHYFARLAQA